MSRTETTIRELYKFEELPEDVRATAIERLHDLNTDYEWWDSDFDDFKAIAALIGIDITDIYFSGFSSQGDGACFEGSFEYKKGGVKALKEYAPIDKELHRIAETLQAIQRPYFYRLSGTVKQSGHYVHEMCTNIEVNGEDGWCIGGQVEEAMIEVLRDFMRWMYKALEKQNDYLTSKEAIKETIEANDYEFDEHGALA